MTDATGGTGGTGASGATNGPTLPEWLETAADVLGLDPASVDSRLVLDLSRDVAHGVERPAAPLTSYLLGVAVGRGGDAAELAGRLRAALPPTAP